MSDKNLVVGHSEGTISNNNPVMCISPLRSTSSIRQFVIQKVYDIENTHHLREMRLIDESGQYVMGGDYYHHKIEEHIEGFFQALDYLGIKYHVECVKLNEVF
jgi:hypothetical protein